GVRLEHSDALAEASRSSARLITRARMPSSSVASPATGRRGGSTSTAESDACQAPGHAPGPTRAPHGAGRRKRRDDMANGTTVTISNDYSNLGDAATREDLERYAENLQAHLAERFDREAVVNIDSVMSATADDADVREY